MIPFKTPEDWNWVHWEAVAFRKEKINEWKQKLKEGVPLNEGERMILKFWRDHYGR